ncbi:helix-turn-helix transcriptional regulator [Paenibacillus mucilaginosus]|uniref:helix-turn-helix transcriptional regulator n=1 Tax=Paenibacillus mucilaginosus TaxID=61624 RepID=UPI003D22EFA0
MKFLKNNLQSLIEAQNLSITDIAKELKVSRGSIYRVMNGGTPSAELLLKVSHFFNKDAREIFFVDNVLPVVQKATQTA